MGSININGRNYSGRSVIITNNRVIIDGKDVTEESKIITVTILGDIESFSADVCESVKIIGNVGSVKTVSGDVEIGGSVNGNVKSVSGDIECGAISGSVETVSGNIKHK